MKYNNFRASWGRSVGCLSHLIRPRKFRVLVERHIYKSQIKLTQITVDVGNALSCCRCRQHHHRENVQCSVKILSAHWRETRWNLGQVWTFCLKILQVLCIQETGMLKCKIYQFFFFQKRTLAIGVISQAVQMSVAWLDVNTQHFHMSDSAIYRIL
jgi:hypothetical protein